LDDGDRSFVDQTAIEVVRPSDLPIEQRQFHQMAAMYTVMELATAIKPWFLRLLLSRAPNAALYLDPDTELFAPVDGVARLAETKGIVLTPHITVPIPRDSLRPREQDLLISGTYNLGFIAVSDEAYPFLEWWQERLYTDCVVDPRAGLFVDQKWIDLAVQFFPYHVLRDPGFNVAYWNLDERSVGFAEAGYTVNGEPLQLFHYSGYDPKVPGVISKHTGDHPRVRLADHDALRTLFDAYRSKLMTEGWAHTHLSEYPFARSASGLTFSPELRHRYRRAVVRGEFPPDPFDPTAEAAFDAWQRRPVIERGVELVRRHVPELLPFLYARGVRLPQRRVRKSRSR
jgi:hypothetical protein